MKVDLSFIGRRIREARVAANLSQAEFAEIVDLSPQYVSHIENGVKNPSLEVVMKIMQEMHIPPEQMFQEVRFDAQSSLDCMVIGCSDQARAVICDVVQGLTRSLKENYGGKYRRK